jgi:hypothetical protein
LTAQRGQAEVAAVPMNGSTWSLLLAEPPRTNLAKVSKQGVCSEHVLGSCGAAWCGLGGTSRRWEKASRLWQVFPLDIEAPIQTGTGPS